MPRPSFVQNVYYPNILSVCFHLLQALTEALKRNSGLIRISLMSNDIGVAGAQAQSWSECISASTCFHLPQALVEALKLNTSVTKIYLFGNPCDRQNAEASGKVGNSWQRFRCSEALKQIKERLEANEKATAEAGHGGMLITMHYDNPTSSPVIQWQAFAVHDFFANMFLVFPSFAPERPSFTRACVLFFRHQIHSSG